jgi:DNA-binding NarL/FixJ family response regulator
MTVSHTILVIEDDPAYRDNMELILRMEGYRVLTATDGTSALAAVWDDPPDLILCDIMMPGMDGRAVFEQLKQDQQTSDIPFIFVTALGGRENIRSGMAAGADDYLTKPFTAEELIDAVKGRLARIRALRLKVDAAAANQEVAWLRRNISRRECEVLLLVGQGATSKQIAEHLGISIRTVESHRTHLMEKLDAPNAAAMAHWAGVAEGL